MQSFDEMFNRYFSRVYRFALRLTQNTDQAEDITQHTFFCALEKIDSFEGRSDVGTWLCSIAKNEYFSRCRKNREELRPPGDIAFEKKLLPGDDDGLMAIHRHLHELDEPYREIFMLRVFGELKFGQIGSLFGKNDNWARTMFYRAKMEMQNRIREEDNE